MNAIPFTSRAGLAGILLALAGLAACETTQTTSGEEYLSRFVAQSEAATAAGSPAATAAERLNREVIAAARVEPILTFPARVGIARIERGRLSAMPEAEAAAWHAVAQRLGPDWGSFIPVSPMVAAMTASCSNGYECASQIVPSIRVAAARQHLDAVLIYEVFGRSGTEDTWLSFFDWTIIGSLVLPTQLTRTAGIAQAALFDVRNGYHYGSANETVEATGLTVNAGSRGVAEARARENAHAAALALAPKVEAMAAKLRAELAERRAGRLEARR